MTNEHDDDPYLWLEEVDGERAMAWVRQRNAISQAVFEGDHLRQTAGRIRAAFDSIDRIPFVVERGAHLYNFWTDASNPRGLWRRTTSESYRSDDPRWETLLDIDALGAAEGTNWVWKGSTWNRGTSTRCLISLSRGGADATEIREFDLPSLQFVDDGFRLPESKGGASWLDDDTLFVDRDFGPGTMSDAGYPRQVRIWRRGEPLADAPILIENDESGPFVGASLIRTRGFEYVLVRRAIDFYDGTKFLWRDGQLIPIEVPQDADVGLFGDRLLVAPRTEWLGFAAGSLIATPIETFLHGDRTFVPVFEPSPRVVLGGWFDTANQLVLTLVDNVRSRIEIVTHDVDGWHRRSLDLPGNGTVQASPLNSESTDLIHLVVNDDITPSTLLELDLAGPGGAPTPLKSAPPRFRSAGLSLTQFEAVSADGTRIPYSVTGPADLDLNGDNPTVLYGYGGFEISLMPEYRSGVGIGWLEDGGLYVVANIRGGGEFGPDWHAAGRKQHRQRCYDDFIAVAEDLIARGFTTPARLGISGGSNGGLLVGAVMTQRPDLFAAVSCAVPLLDMRRYHLLLAGQSWMAEYGDPDNPDEWEYISRYSPYQNLRPGVSYPKVLFTTSTRDDRVHPGHARKMMARMLELGQDCEYYENIEGGHGGSADNEQMAYRTALGFEFFRRALMSD